MSRAFTVTGSDPSRDTTLMDRAYQIYAFLIVVGALAFLWIIALAQIESVFSGMPAESAGFVFRILLIVAALALGFMGAKAVDRGPFSYSHADIAYLVTGRIDLGFVMFSGYIVALTRALIIGAIAGFAFGVAAEATGLDVSFAASAALFASIFGSVVGFPWAVGAIRVFRTGPGRGSIPHSSLPFEPTWRRWTAKGSMALIAILLVFLIASMASGFLAGAFTLWLGPALCVLIVTEAALVLFLGRRADSSAIAQEASLSYGTKLDMLSSLSANVAFGADAIKDEKRRARVIRRKPILGLPKSEGAAAILGRAALSVARQREGWPLLVAAGAAIAPFGAYAVSSGSNPILSILWLFALQKSARAVREIARPFADDMRIRTIRDSLPFRTSTLFALGTLPGFAMALCAQGVVFAIASLLSTLPDAGMLGTAGGEMAEIAPLALLTLVGMALCCAFDSARSFLRPDAQIGYELPAFLLAGVPSLMAMMGAPSSGVLAMVAVLDLVLAAFVFDRVG